MNRGRVVLRLIELGSAPDIDSEAVVRRFEDLRGEGEMGCDGGWVCQIAPGLDDRHLVALHKGIVVSYRHFEWQDSSVNAAVWSFEALLDRDRKLYEDMLDWTAWTSAYDWPGLLSWLHHCREYAMRQMWERAERESADAGMSLEAVIQSWISRAPKRLACHRRRLEFLKRMLAAEQARSRRSPRDVERERQEHLRAVEEQRLAAEQAERRAAERLEEQRQRRQAHEDVRRRKAEARSRALADGESSGWIRKLELVCEHSEHPVHFFPAAWARVPQETLSTLPDELRIRLEQRLEGVRKGSWRRLAHRLR